VIEQGNPMVYATPSQQPPREPAPQQVSTAQGIAQVLMTAVLVALAFCAGWFGNVYTSHNSTVSSSDPNEQAIFQAYQAITQGYVEPSAINRQQMANDAINAMVTDLGDTGHSRFQTPQEIQQENSQLQGKPTVGIGVVLSGGGSQPLRIDEVVPGSSADKAHLLPGDEIVAVNGKTISGMTIDQVRPLIVGAQGTQVTLGIVRPPATTPFSVTLTREPFSLPFVSTYVIPGVNLADIQLTQFGADGTTASDSTDGELRAALQSAAVTNASGIILDLRDNGGGYLDQAVDVASEFVPAQTGGKANTVYIDETRTARTPEHVLATGLATAKPQLGLATKPLVVLINGNTASAAEIVTAAIQYNRPSVHLVGEHTFGTHTILTPIPLANGGQILLGTQAWLTPAGQNARNVGIAPDQVVALPNAVPEVTPIVAKEQNLSGQQILTSSDVQLKQAISDLTGQS
jgi:carboxyl-terminal processing protease